MIRVLVVDDSPVVRKILTEALTQSGDIEVVGTARDPYVARDKVVSLKPDVLTLDIAMPRMDGLSFLTKLMRYHPIPVVIVSSVAPRQSEAALKALLLGAVEVVPKPAGAGSLHKVADHLARAIRAAASARIGRRVAPNIAGARPQLSTLTAAQKTTKIVAVGASTGGTWALETLLTQMPPDAPGIVMVQHMPAPFTGLFARRLNTTCRVEVREAKDCDRVVPGLALLAPGGHHLTVQKAGGGYAVRVKDGPPVHHQRPSVDVLFHSVARAAGSNAVGVIMTGMGSDGAEGLLAMRQRQAHTIAEHEDSCVVFGMPKEAIRLGAASEVVPLQRIATHVLRALDGKTELCR